MTVRPAETDGERPLSSPDETIVYTPLPRSAGRLPWWTMLVAIGLYMAAALSPLIFGVGGEGIVCAVFLVTLIFGSIALGVYIPFSKRLMHLDSIQDAIHPFGKLLLELDRAMPFIASSARSPWQWQEIEDVRAFAGLPRPRTIVAGELEKRLRSIETPSHFFEPEPILGSLWMSRGYLTFFLFFYALMIVMQFIAGNVWMAGMFLVFGGFLLLHVPAVRDFFRPLRQREGNFIAGMGTISDHRSRVWTVDDALMIVRTVNGYPPLHVSIIGAAGEAHLTFMDEKDPDFVKLWQRWNHPQPRPELVME